MRELVIISGKGGTGKTVTTGAFATLAKSKVMADCDVDAADLHLLLQPEIKEEKDFLSGTEAVINKELCNECGLCRELCRFEAISEDYTVNPIACEGCDFCANACPQKAIKMVRNPKGKQFVSNTRYGTFVHAKLGIGEDNSGKLVSSVRKKANEIGKTLNSDWIIIDGSPGIGCPVIASMGGANCALIITEPTMSGLHDADRIIKTAKHFNVPVKLIINKYDLNIEMSDKIEDYCKSNDISLIGKLGFDKIVVEAMVNGKTIIEYAPNSEISHNLCDIWNKIDNEVI
ncbi:MAG: 4Fe-4S binding protein [Elusimicrobiales bacterium]|nr:4Fe-4S binding protein [Elusimicrobiales bacterium]MCK5583727.1 4Fe-4S binding protein [Elusimicrobiales bacterium]